MSLVRGDVQSAQPFGLDLLGSHGTILPFGWITEKSSSFLESNRLLFLTVCRMAGMLSGGWQ